MAQGIDQTLVTFTPEEQYAHVTLTYVVDNVCLHAAKVAEVQASYQAQILEEQGSGKDGAEQRAALLQQQMTEEVQAVPLLAVPRSSKSRKKTEGAEAQANPAVGEKAGASAGQAKKAAEKERAAVQLLNEQGIPSGKFGWCVACRAPANLYCKHTRHPVCSFECK